METLSSQVYKCLDKKTLILGFEIMDLFVLALLLAVLNFFTGNSEYKLLLTWMPVSLLAIVLKLVKRGKPDLFLTHWIKFQVRPKQHFAFFQATTANGLLRIQSQQKKAGL